MTELKSLPRSAAAYLAVLSFVALFLLLGLATIHAYAPALVSPASLAPLVWLLALASTLAVLSGLAHVLLAYPNYRREVLVLTLLVLVVLGAHLYTINDPGTASCVDKSKGVQGCVMDESYYVPAAQTLLSGAKCAPFQDNCNLEHPFLNKAAIAAGILVFGDDTFGWRIFNVILGTFSIPLLFGLCLEVTGNKRLSIYAAFLFGFETLFFVHSSIAVIDVGAVFFGLLGFLFYFSKVRVWRLSHIALAGISLGVATLCKETAALLFLFLLFYHLFYAEGNRGQVTRSTGVLTFWTVAVFCIGLEVYDGAFGAGTATTFLGQIAFIMAYGESLVRSATDQGWIDTVLKTPITPLNWVTYYSPVPYFVTNTDVTTPTGGYSYTLVGYYGASTLLEVWLVYVWGPYVVYQWRRARSVAFASESDSREFVLARFALLWFLVIFCCYVVLYFYGRITYPYYFIEAIPAIAIGGAYLLSRDWFPRPAAYLIFAGVLVWFFILYPDKSFLPLQLRIWIARLE